MNSSSKINTNTAIAVMIAVVCIIAIICFMNGCKSEPITENDDSVSEPATTAVNLDENVQFAISNTTFSVPPYSNSPDNLKIVTDTETGVEYLYIYDKSGYGSGCSITPLYNEDGSLKINPLYKKE